MEIRYIELNNNRLIINNYLGYKCIDGYFTINSLSSLYENNYLIIGYINNCYSFFVIKKSSDFYQITHLEEISRDKINRIISIDEFIKDKKYEYPLRIDEIELDEKIHYDKIKRMNYEIKVGLRKRHYYNLNELYMENGKVIGMILKKKWGSLIINPSVIIRKYLLMLKNEIPYDNNMEFNLEFLLRNETIDDLDNYITIKYHKICIDGEYQLSYPIIHHLSKLNHKYKISEIIKNKELLKEILE